MWLAETRLRLEGTTLHIGVPDSFKLERIRRNFQGDLIAAVRDVTGLEPELALAIDPEAKAEARRPSPSPAAGPAAPAQKVLFSDEEAPPVQASAPEATAIAPPAVPFRLLRRAFASLETFVVGNGNRVAHAAATSLLGRLGRVSPLTIYGPAGCGKTHLLEAIWTAARKSGKVRSVIYLTAEQFTTHFVDALKGAGLPSFRKKYRDVELLLIDDLQFFAGKQSTLVELLYTIDTLLREGRQLVLAADRAPADLRFLGPDIVARISGGLVCDMEPADYETRLRILAQIAQREQIAAGQEVLSFLASQLPGDARPLAGALHRLAAVAEVRQAAITVELAHSALSDLLLATKRAVRLQDIVGAVCDLFGLAPEQIQSDSRSPTVSHPRMLAMWLARKYTRSALSEISRYFQRKSHTTVLSAEETVKDWLARGKSLSLPQGECRVEEALRRVELQLRLA